MKSRLRNCLKRRFPSVRGTAAARPARPRFRLLEWLILLVVCGILPRSLVAATGWPALPPADLAMREFAAQPGARAVILDRTFDCDVTKSRIDDYFVRIKILTESGKDQGNIRIPYFSSLAKVVDVEARTVDPDGSVHPFTGQVFDTVVAQSRKLGLHEKSFSMPDVHPGSVLDYRYRVVWKSGFSPLPTWKVQSDLFIRHEHFSVRSSRRPIAWVAKGLNPKHQPVEHSSGSRKSPISTLTLDESNIAPVVDEPYSLPRVERTARVDLFYDLIDPKSFWSHVGEIGAMNTEMFIGNPRKFQHVAAGVIGDATRTEDKLRALYAWLLTFRNLTLEAGRPNGIQDARHVKKNNSVKDVLEHQYGTTLDINTTFVALARAAGLKAWLVLNSSRDGSFFSTSLPDFDQLDSTLAEVKVGDHSIFYDPGIGAPFGVIPWFRTEVTGIRLEEKGGVLETTAPASATHSRIDRTGTFHLTSDGTLQGELQVNFEGDEAFERTVHSLALDSKTRDQYLVERVSSWLPERASVRLLHVNGWSTSEPVLAASFAITIPGFAQSTGSRLLFPQGILETNVHLEFPSSHRQGMVYFHAPWVMSDAITVNLPPGYRAEGIPDAVASPSSSALRYEGSTRVESGILQWQRTLTVDSILFPVSSYSTLRTFFAATVQNDQRQVVLQRTEQVSSRSPSAPASFH